jgi:hypothetical protein
MVRNTIGGCKHKSLARKSQTSQNHVAKDTMPSSPLEQLAVVLKNYGNGMCQVQTLPQYSAVPHSPVLTLLCHIRGKFRGRHKKQNQVLVGNSILVGLREWESDPTNCDLLMVMEQSYQQPVAAASSNCGGGSGGKLNLQEDSFIFSNEEDGDEEVECFNGKHVFAKEPKEIEIDFDAI